MRKTHFLHTRLSKIGQKVLFFFNQVTSLNAKKSGIKTNSVNQTRWKTPRECDSKILGAVWRIEIHKITITRISFVVNTSASSAPGWSHKRKAALRASELPLEMCIIWMQICFPPLKIYLTSSGKWIFCSPVTIMIHNTSRAGHPTSVPDWVYLTQQNLTKVFFPCELLIVIVSITTIVNGPIQNKDIKDSEAKANDHLRLEVNWKAPSTFVLWSKAFWLRWTFLDIFEANSWPGGFKPAYKLWTNRQCFQETRRGGATHFDFHCDNKMMDAVYENTTFCPKVREAKQKLEKQKAETIVKLQEVLNLHHCQS